jgi:putative DNA primase/helicase
MTMRSLSRRRTDDAPLPQDEHAERAAIGCVLYDADHPDLDPALIVHDGRRALLITALTLKAQGGEHWPAPSGQHPRDLLAAAHARGERVLRAIRQSRIHDDMGAVEDELWQALDVTTRPEDLDYHVGLLLDTWRRRQALRDAERLRDAAHDPSADLADVYGRLDVTSLMAGPRQHTARMTCLADVESVPIRWLWPGRIARGKLSLIAGQPGLGKSLLSIDLAARVSRGWEWPDGQPAGPPADVILLSAEDDPADTIRPRLDAAGADVRHVHLLEGREWTDRETGETRQRTVSLGDLPAIRDALEQLPGCRLLIVDPITAYLDGIDSHRNSDVRALLAPLTGLAQHYDVALVAITHLNKCGDGARPALDRVSGSQAFAAAARCVWLVARDPDRADRRIVAIGKSNLTADSDGLAYAVETAPGPQGASVPLLAWEEDPVPISAEDLLAPRQHDPDSSGSALEEAIEWLKDQLADGPVTARDLKAAATRDGLSWGGALRRAKDALGIKPAKDGFRDGWCWSLPDPSKDAQPPAQDAQAPQDTEGCASCSPSDETLKKPAP